jgi:hypothetical protein
MNKTLRILSFLMLTAITVNAQITLTQANLPVAGSAFILATDSTYAANITPGGANQTWDYSGLVNGSQDTMGFVASSASPYASSFPLANLAANSQKDSVWTFFINNATGFYVNGAYPYGVNGIAGVSNFALVYNPSQIFAPVPFTFGNTRNDVSRFKIDIDTLSQHLRFVHRTESTLEADGYGSLILPNGTYPNTIRIKTIATVYDSVFVDLLGIGFYTLLNSSVTQSSNYHWYRNSQPAYLLGLDGDSLGTVMSSSEYILNGTSTGIEQPQSTVKSVAVYPNPATAQINFILPETAKNNTTIKIYNTEGKLVRETIIDGLNGYGFGTSNMENGLYFYSIVGSDTNYNGRFVVAH